MSEQDERQEGPMDGNEDDYGEWPEVSLVKPTVLFIIMRLDARVANDYLSDPQMAPVFVTYWEVDARVANDYRSEERVLEAYSDANPHLMVGKYLVGKVPSEDEPYYTYWQLKQFNVSRSIYIGY